MKLNNEIWFKQILKVCFIVLAMLFIGMIGFATVKAFADSGETTAADQQKEALSETQAKVRCWAFLAAAVSTGLGTIAAGIAVAHVGAAALGTIGERPELAGRALIFVGLAEGLAILGLLTSILILGNI